MKELRRAWLIACLGMLCFPVWAQQDVFFVPDPQTAVWSYVTQDAAGQPTSRMIYSVEEMTGNAVNGSAKIKMQVVAAQAPTDTVKSLIFYRFKEGECILDMQAVFGEALLGQVVEEALAQEGKEVSPQEKQAAIAQMQERIKITGELRGIPRYPQIGALPDYKFRFKFMVMSMTMEGEERKITGKERISTPAGDYDCFVVEETVTMKAMMNKEVEKTVSWYAYGIGMVKQLSYDKKGQLQSVTLLDTINW